MKESDGHTRCIASLPFLWLRVTKVKVGPMVNIPVMNKRDLLLLTSLDAMIAMAPCKQI